MSIKKTFLKTLVPLWPILVLIGAVFLVYSSVYNNAFLFDDEFLIQKNSYLRSWDNILKIFMNSSTAGSGRFDSFYRPMQGLLYLIIFQIFGLSTFGFHLLNVTIHAINAALVYALGRKINISRNVSLLAAIIWAVHPMQTEAVTYQSATADTLYVFWILVGLLVLLPDFDWRKSFFASFCFILAILSKESAIVFPLLAMSLLYFKTDNRWSWRTYVRTWPFWLLALIYLLLRKTVLNFADTFHFYKSANIYTENIQYRIYTFFATLPAYLKLIVFPVHLRMERSFPVFVDPLATPVLIGMVIVLVFLLVLALVKAKQQKIFVWAGLWFFFAQVPHMGILLPVNSLFLEHWMYLPSIGLFLGIFAGVFNSSLLKRYHTHLTVLSLMVALGFGYQTYLQNKIWENSFTFYGNILKYETGTDRVHNNVAIAYSDIGDLSRAAEHFRRAIQISRGRSPHPHHNLARVLLRLGESEKAIEHLKTAIEIDPDFYYSYNLLAGVYKRLGNEIEAQKYLSQYKEVLKKLNLSE